MDAAEEEEDAAAARFLSDASGASDAADAADAESAVDVHPTRGGFEGGMPALSTLSLEVSEEVSE